MLNIINDKSSVAIYGTGNNARLLLENDLSNRCKYVISDDNNLKEYCGHKVVTLAEAVDSIDKIVIAAVPYSTKIIYNRIIGEIPNTVSIYDIRGHYLNEVVSAEDYLSRFVVCDKDKKYFDDLIAKRRFVVGRYTVDSFEAIADLIAPITTLFLIYINLISTEYEKLLFPSRDGYFLLEMYKTIFRNDDIDIPKVEYLLTSRDAINQVDDNYYKYLQSLKLNGKCAIIDIVTQGTVVAGVSKVVNNNIDLIAMGTTELPNDNISDTGRIHSLLGQINERKGDIRYSFDDFSELHLFLELLYSSEQGQFVGMSDNNIPLFNKMEYSVELILGVQTCLKARILKEDLLNDKESFSYDFAKALLRMFYRKHANYNNEIRKMFTFDDPYDEKMHNCNLIDKLGW